MTRHTHDVTKCGGYDLVSISETNRGFRGKLKLRGSPANAYGEDITHLTLIVDYETRFSKFKAGSSMTSELLGLRVQISDDAGTQPVLPASVLPYPASDNEIPTHELEFCYDSQPFAFWIIRRTTGDIIFDTRPRNIPVFSDPVLVPDPNTEYDSSGSGMWGLEDSDKPFMDEKGKDLRTIMPAHPLVFEDQYLQMSTSLPVPANIYGLGEIISSSGFRRDDKLTIATMWNRDAGGSPTDQTMYASHPFYMDVRRDIRGELYAHGVALRNCHGMDVLLRPGVLQYRVIGGIFDLYYFAGPGPEQVVEQYSAFTGKPAQMPYWAFGFHMLRWEGEFANVEGVRSVVERMRRENIPYETIWSDLDHMEERKNWTCNPNGYQQGEFRALVDWLHDNDQRFVPLIDVAIGLKGKSGSKYPPYEAGHKRGVFVQNVDGSEYVGRVWPGLSVYPDWWAPDTTEWWSDENKRFHAKIPFDGVWLDMNEPTNFLPGLPGVSTDATIIRTLREHERGEPLSCLRNGVSKYDAPSYAICDGWKGLGRMTISPTARHRNGLMHYSMHNLYSLGEVQATYHGLKRDHPESRPFILTRSSSPGTGAVAAKWLGDNRSTWQSMRDSVQGILQFQLFQIPMIGPDACGMGQGIDVTEELAARWMQLAAFFPFLRSHNGNDSASQYPYKWESVAQTTRKVLKTRYQLLPYWESLFIQARLMGTPPVQPLFFQFPRSDLLNHDTQFMIGSALLVTPVLHEGSISVRGVFPSTKHTTWRNWWTHEVVEPGPDDVAFVKASLLDIPVHIKSGTLIPIHERSQYSMTATRKEPLALIINLSIDGEADGAFWLDDGLSIDGAFRLVKVTVRPSCITIVSEGSYEVPLRNTLTSITLLNANKTMWTLESNLIDKESVNWDSQTRTCRITDLNVNLNQGHLLSWTQE